MKLPNRPARLNRALLFFIGLILLAAGAFELATRFGAIHLVPRAQALTFLDAHPQGWVAYAALAVSVVVALAMVRWLAAQAMRRPRTRPWRVTADPVRGSTMMHADTAAAPLAADIESYDGVRSAAAWLTGPRYDPALYLRVRTEFDADLIVLRGMIHDHALPRLRGALELEGLPSAVIIEPTSPSARTR